jgi:hypothetical protein
MIIQLAFDGLSRVDFLSSLQTLKSMKYLALLVLALLVHTLNAQNAAVALEAKPHSPPERYLLMKSNSQTFQDYKVIKETILDGVWKIAMDTLAKRESSLSTAQARIKSLENDLAMVRSDLKSKEESMSDVVFASTHINVVGKSFSKSLFLALAAVTLAGLLLIIVLLVIRMKAMQFYVNENKVIVTSITHEFDEFKRHALEKEIKLSRELQTERNKVLELKSAPRS